MNPIFKLALIRRTSGQCLGTFKSKIIVSDSPHYRVSHYHPHLAINCEPIVQVGKFSRIEAMKYGLQFLGARTLA
jgi:hypothetical protein